MPLSIKNPRAEELAREVAAESGESITLAIINALEERLMRLKGRHRAENIEDILNQISRRCSELPGRDTRSADEILGYNENGVNNGH